MPDALFLSSLYVFSHSALTGFLRQAQDRPFDFRRVAPYASFDFAPLRYAQDRLLCPSALQV